LEDSTKFINELAANKIKVDCVILDPPRTGTTYNFISAVAKMGIKRVVYVSCGPETLARDLKIFKDFGYEIKNARCVDMFPRTEHVESVCLLSKVEK
jgi:23S rRNA (uracil1939-C5)-methyltransferase